MNCVSLEFKFPNYLKLPYVVTFRRTMPNQISTWFIQALCLEAEKVSGTNGTVDTFVRYWRSFEDRSNATIYLRRFC